MILKLLLSIFVKRTQSILTVLSQQPKLLKQQTIGFQFGERNSESSAPQSNDFRKLKMDNHSRIYNDISSTDKFDESSDEFKAFLSRVKDLEVKFIPEIKIHEEISSPDYSGDPTQIFDQDIIRAFILLTHAETEDYFESLARKVCTAEYINWKNNGTPSDIVINLIATHYSGWDKLDCTIKEYKPLTDQQIKKVVAVLL